MSDGQRFTLDELRQAVDDAGLTPRLCDGCHQPMRVRVTDRVDASGQATRIRIDHACTTPGCEFNTEASAG